MSHVCSIDTLGWIHTFKLGHHQRQYKDNTKSLMLSTSVNFWSCGGMKFPLGPSPASPSDISSFFNTSELQTPSTFPKNPQKTPLPTNTEHGMPNVAAFKSSTRSRPGRLHSVPQISGRGPSRYPTTMQNRARRIMPSSRRN